MNLWVFLPPEGSETLAAMASHAASGWVSRIPGVSVNYLGCASTSNLPGNGGLLFCTEPDAAGAEPEGTRFLRSLLRHTFESTARDPGCQEGPARDRHDGPFMAPPPQWYGKPAGILALSPGNLYTKRTAQDAMFCLNSSGYMLPGKALVEGVGNLFNMRRLSTLLGSNSNDALMASCRALGERMAESALAAKPHPVTAEGRRTAGSASGQMETKTRRPLILGVHSATSGRSNTLWVWKQMASILEDGGASVATMSLDPEKIVECRGCSFSTCRHYGERVSCFYGGQVSDEIFPAILKADALVVLAPNYNDAPPANLCAFFNRLSALYHADSAVFFQKTLGIVAVSGYSGSDCVIKNVMSALCLNKGFSVMPEGFFELLANDPGEAEGMGSIPGAERFARNLLAWTQRTLSQPDRIEDLFRRP